MKKIEFKKIKIQWTIGRIIKLVMVALIITFLVISGVYKFAGNKGAGMGGAGGKSSPGMAGAKGRGAGAGGQGVAVITVSAKKIEPETIQNTVKVTGNVSSVSEISIYPDTSGKILSIEKNLGDSIKKGERIASIDPSKPGASYVASPVVATVSGTVIDLPVSVGEAVSSSTAIATVGSLTDLQLKIHVAEKYSA